LPVKLEAPAGYRSAPERIRRRPDYQNRPAIPMIADLGLAFGEDSAKT